MCFGVCVRLFFFWFTLFGDFKEYFFQISISTRMRSRLASVTSEALAVQIKKLHSPGLVTWAHASIFVRKVAIAHMKRGVIVLEEASKVAITVVALNIAFIRGGV